MGQGGWSVPSEGNNCHSDFYLYRRVCVSVYPSGRIHVAACGPIGTKFGTRMEIHLEMVMGEIKITPCDLGGIWGGFRGQKITNLE